MYSTLGCSHITASRPLPLVIDLDGTLLRTDLLLETGLAFLKTHPASFLEPFKWLAKGKARLKDELARATHIDVSVLPYNPEVIELIEIERSKGRKLVLATASHHTLATRIADHLDLFDEIIASDGEINLSAGTKRDVLVRRYGAQGFDYAGNSHDDIPVMRAARRAYLVNPESGVERRSRSLGNIERVIRSRETLARDWAGALRLHQWLKNLLIFIPLLAAHRLDDSGLILDGLLAFFLFGLCASSVYLLNDLLDLEDDRRHSTKCRRPFASGHLSISAGLVTIPLLLAGGFSGAIWLLPAGFAGGLLVYYALTLLYSLALKHWVVIDVILLASLYTLRVIIGGAVFAIPLSFWMLAFSLFFFLSLALVKRCTELRHALDCGHNEQTPGRAYCPSDLPILASLGTASGYISVMVLALYIRDADTSSLYRHPELIWLACPLLLFWITRTWVLSHRGQMDDDPVIFAVRDRTSLITGGLFALVFWGAA